ncbi:MAG: hypothetical protein K6G62_05175 [Eubacterium sp.]|nr:hypothetical protein [Eubacterium sp.]
MSNVVKNARRVVVRDAKEVEDELAAGYSVQEIFRVPFVPVGGDEAKESEEFSEGLPVTRLDEELNEMRKKAQEASDEIIASARAQADDIVVEARRQADDVRAQAHADGFEAGREEGIRAGTEEIDRIREEIENERVAREADYAAMVADLEPQFVRVICELVEKLTGVVIENQDELILHLIRLGLADVRKNAERIIIRVCPEDSLIAEKHKNELLTQVGDGVTIEIQSRDGMEKNECIIETDNQMLDAGIHTQLDNMLAAIKMMV